MEVKFLSPLNVEEIDDKKWRLLADFRVSIYNPDAGVGGLLLDYVTVPAGFVTDFASVPRLPLAFLLCGDTAHKAAVLHDYLYSIGANRAYADAALRAGMCACGEPSWRRWSMWSMVRLFGGGNWTKPGGA